MARRKSAERGRSRAMQWRAPNQQTITEQLLHVEDRINLCRKHIDRQQALIAAQIEKGSDPGAARRLLGDITNLLSMNIIERDRLKRELDELLK
jgi:hypothetical protein